MAVLSEGLEELTDVILMVKREARLYKDQRLYGLVERVYYELMEALGLCIIHFRQVPKLLGQHFISTFRPTFNKQTL